MPARRSRSAFTTIAALALLAVAAAIIATGSASATDVDSDITSSTTWTVAGSPYNIKVDVTVTDGATLTIQNGTLVKFVDYYYLSTAGTGKIVATGTEDSYVTFTSGKGQPNVGDWNYLSTGASGSLEYVNITYGSVCLYVESLATVKHCNLRTGTTGIIMRGTGGLVEDSLIWGMNVGLSILDGANCKVVDCQADNCLEGFIMTGTTESSLFEGCFNNNSVNWGFGYNAGGNYNEIRNGTVTRSQYGVAIKTLSTSPATRGLLVYGCYLHACSQVGIDFETVLAQEFAPIIVKRCQVLEGNVGLKFTASANIEVTECTFKRNNLGMSVLDSTGYTILVHRNNFIDSASDEATSTNSEVQYDVEGYGNYWREYITEYGGTDNNGDGIGDNPYYIEGLEKDNRPLMTPVDFNDPVAEAGPNQKVRQHRSFDLDGSGSSDDTFISNFTWTVDLPGEDLVVYEKRPRLTIDVAGVFTVTLQVTDPVGHVATDTLNVNVTDADSPVFVNVDVPSAVSAGTPLNFSCELSDNMGVKVVWVIYRFGLSGQTKRLDLVAHGDGNWSGEVLIPVDLRQIVYYAITAKDFEGNVARSSDAEVNVRDTLPPVVESELPENVTTGDLTWINFTITDNREVSSASIAYWFGEGTEVTNVSLTQMGLLWVAEVEVPYVLASPMYIRVNATDLAGNVLLTDPFEVPVLDNDAPIRNTDIPPIDFHKGEDAFFRVMLSDNDEVVSAFVEVRYPPSDDWERTPLVRVDLYYTASVAMPAVGVRVNYRYWAVDPSGNVMTTEEVENYLLSMRPEITTDPPAEAYEDQLYEVDFEADDPDSLAIELLWLMNTNATWLSIDKASGVLSGTPSDLHVGWYWVNVTVTDPEGVTDYLEFNVTVLDVNAAPVVTISSPLDGTKIGSVLKVTGKVQDDLDVIEWIRVRIDEGEWMNVTAGKVWSYEQDVSSLEPGEHYVDVIASDGISESNMATVTIEIPEPPPDDSPGPGAGLAATAVLVALLVELRRRRRP